MSECDDGRGFWLAMVHEGMVGKVGRGVPGACLDGVNRSSYFTELFLHARPCSPHFPSINSFLLLNHAEVRTLLPVSQR